MKLSQTAINAGVTVEKRESHRAYPLNGNAHNPTIYYRWWVYHDGRPVDSAAKRSTAIESANEYASSLGAATQ